MNYCETLKYLKDYVKQEIKEIMKAEIFKVGDRVYNYKYGWGEITSYEENAIIRVKFFANTIAFMDGNLLSFTEYTLQGFSQERPIVLPEVGEDVLVYDGYNSEWILRQFQRYVKCSIYPFHVTDRDSFLSSQYSKMKRIKILD